MHIDWDIVAAFAAPIFTLMAGIWIDRHFGDRANLISYYMHVSAFRSTLPTGQAFFVNTHSVVVRNTGRRAATNLRLSHVGLPDFNIWPHVQHRTEVLPDGSTDIVVPVLVPGEQIIVSYLYFPPQTAEQINAGIKCDQGFAQAIPVILQRQYPAWFNKLAIALFVIGVIAIFYLVYYYGFRHLFHFVR